MTAESPEVRLKRLRMRSWRRGTREMDLVLGPYADAHLAAMDAAALDLFEALLDENDQEILPWITGQTAAPARFGALVQALRDFARSRPQGVGPHGPGSA